jgi:NAD(P)-dependent dehydrogenase (short-subunit alcohol dehydrogenase family)
MSTDAHSATSGHASRSPKRVLVIGASGTVGSAVAEALTAAGHEVIAASRRSTPPVDLADPPTIERLFDAIEPVDAVVSCAASALPTPLTDPGFAESIGPKLHGQIELVVQAVEHLRDGGSITLTSGAIPDDMAGTAGGALVNAGLEAFVKAAVIDLPRGPRLNVVRPGWVAETLASLDMDEADGTPAAVVARSYVEAVDGRANGTTITP